MSRHWINRSAALAVLVAFLVLSDAVTDALRQRWALTLFQAGVFGLTLLWVARWIARGGPLRGSILLLPLGGAALWGPLQLAAGWSVHPFVTLDAALGWAANLAVFWLALQVCGEPETRHKLRNGLLYFGFVVSVLSSAAFFTSQGKIFWLLPTQYSDNVLGPFVSRDHYSSFIALLLPLAVYGAVREPKRRVLYSLMTGVMFASVIEGASRAGSILVTLELAFLLLPLLFGGARAGAGALAARIVCFVMLFSAVVGWEVLWDRFKDPDPYQIRREMLYSSLDMVRERPLTGFGLGAWPTVYPAYALLDQGVIANHAHNDWAEWACDGGVFFLAMLLAVFFWSARAAFRMPWGLGVAAVFLHCLVDFPMQKASITALLFLLLGALAAARGEASCRRPASG